MRTLLLICLISISCSLTLSANIHEDETLYYHAVEAKSQKNYTKAISLLTQLSDKNYGRAKYQLAIMYLLGQGVKVNTTKGMALMKESADLHTDDALNFLGEAYYHGRDVPQDRKHAAQLINESKQLGNKKAIYLWKYYKLDQYE